MRKEIKKLSSLIISFVGILVLVLFVHCDEENSNLAPYMGETYLSEMTIEKQTLKPKLTWLGGYVSAFGVNRGSKACLDSTLQWLIKTDGNNLQYPVEYGVVPEGATDLTEQYGGKFDEFIEDSTYTCWVVKEEGWDSIIEHPGNAMAQAELDTGISMLNNNTLLIDKYQYLRETRRIDIYTNIDRNSIKLRGGLAKIELTETDTSNSPVITWEIIDDDVTDTLVAATGVCEGVAYDPTALVWEVWSMDTIEGEVKYGKKNVIQQPLVLGESIPGTRVFKQYPAEGLSRNKNYLFWIAGEDWDGEKHLRFTKHHAYITFKTW
ncbi:MAG: hypothetical protein K9M80_00830 [Candidatus Marinimicrobia bacterium]|nr:hypothetical protein [Candidatus Neomarinimicrobiota bacterium]